MSDPEGTPQSVRWARLRFAIVGPLLASPPEHGQLQARIAELTERSWKHPSTGEMTRFDFKTIERWYYVARATDDPVGALARKVPKHAGTYPSVSLLLGAQLRTQHAEHPRWTYKLHYDELLAVARERPELGQLPGYATVRRWMKSHGLYRRKKKRDARRRQVTDDIIAREKRSYEVEYVNALWHLDFHECSRAVLLPSGAWKKPQLLGILDDHSRLGCHLQWYLDETAESLAHGLMQAFLKRQLPRGIMMDQGSAMKAAEIVQGLARLGITQQLTLEYSP